MAATDTDHGGDLFRLIYASRAVLPVLPRFEGTVADILAVSEINNARDGLTGLLLAHQGWFVQALEGPRRALSRTFGVIGRDLRHAQLEVIAAGAVDSRLFGRWSMCTRSVTGAAEPVLKTLDLVSEFDPFRLDAEKALALLVAIAKVPAAPLKKAS